MRYAWLLLIGLLCFRQMQAQQSISQIMAEQKKRNIQVGDSAPDFILTVGDNSIRSFTLPQLKRISLLHFWDTHEANFKMERGHLLRLLDHYENANYINAAGFEIIAIAVQSDMDAWRAAIEHDSLNRVTHGMAVKGLEDEVCKLYNVPSLPYDVLVDERGIIAAINPRMIDIENMLDGYKNYQPLHRDISAVLASAGNRNEVVKHYKLQLLNYYGDSITYTSTNSKGEFSLHDLKLNQDFILKVNDQNNILTGPVALYTRDEGEFVLQGRPQNGGYVFNIPTRLANRLILPDSAALAKHTIEELDVIKSLVFADNGKRLMPKDEKELNVIVTDMQKNPHLRLDFTTHTDSKIDTLQAMEITSNQVNAIKNYFQKKGLDLCRITGIAKGNSEMRKLCLGAADCTEEDHRLNRRVEFWIYRELTD